MWVIKKNEYGAYQIGYYVNDGSGSTFICIVIANSLYDAARRVSFLNGGSVDGLGW